MDKKAMEDFFKMVGFVPPEEGGTASDSRAADASEGTRSAGHSSRTEQRRPDEGQSAWSVISGGKGGKGGKKQGSGEGFSFPDWGRKAIITGAIVLVALIAGAYWWFHPPINIHSSDCWVFLAIFVLLPLFLVFKGLRGAYETGTGKRVPNASKAGRFKWAARIPVAIAVLGVIGALASLSLWPGNAERYSSVLDVRDGDFAADIQEVNYNSIPVIDRDSAALLGNRTLGEIPDYVSQFEISGMYSQINYKGRPVRVSPLNYADLFKWFFNKDTGIPAYVMVDMASQDTQVVRLDQPMYYSESDPLERNIDRYVQLKYPLYMFEEKSFEVDDDGTPYWICPVQTRTIGLFGGETISRVVLVNASTGECQDLAIEDVPQWVDRAYPSNLLIQQYNWFGSLSRGWLNSWLGQSGVVQTTPGRDGELGYNYIAKDDDVWVYTGVTSATADNSIVGFVLVNQRTAEARFYSVAGATEASAMASAEGQVQNLRYNATFPLLLNINGQPTYFMALKDSAGLVKKFAMLDIQRYQNVAVGDTVQDAQKSYKSLLATNGVLNGDSGLSKQSATGTIKTIAQAVVDGNSHFYLTLEGDTHIYDCPLPTLIEVVGYGVGDKVTISYVEGTPTSTVQSVEAAAAKANTPAAAGAASGASSSTGTSSTTTSSVTTG